MFVQKDGSHQEAIAQRCSDLSLLASRYTGCEAPILFH